MHELHLAEDILRLVKEKAQATGKQKIATVKVAIGQARTSHQAELKELFAMIAKGTVAEGAKLEIAIIPLKSICANCQSEFNPQVMRLDCAKCGSSNIKVTSGQELQILELI